MNILDRTAVPKIESTRPYKTVAFLSVDFVTDSLRNLHVPPIEDYIIKPGSLNEYDFIHKTVVEPSLAQVSQVAAAAVAASNSISTNNEVSTVWKKVKPTRKGFSIEDDATIIKATRHPLYKKVPSEDFFRALTLVIPNHTFNSIKHRFHKQLMANKQSYRMSTEFETMAYPLDEFDRAMQEYAFKVREHEELMRAQRESPIEGMPRVSSVTRLRNTFTPEEDELLINFMLLVPEGRRRGNAVFNSLANVYREHSGPAWRNRWVRYISQKESVIQRIKNSDAAIDKNINPNAAASFLRSGRRMLDIQHNSNNNNNRIQDSDDFMFRNEIPLQVGDHPAEYGISDTLSARDAQGDPFKPDNDHSLALRHIADDSGSEYDTGKLESLSQISSSQAIFSDTSLSQLVSELRNSVKCNPSDKMIEDALLATNMDFNLSKLYIETIHNEKRIPETRGIWTERDDRIFTSSSTPDEFLRVLRKHGQDNLEQRRDTLEKIAKHSGS